MRIQQPDLIIDGLLLHDHRGKHGDDLQTGVREPVPDSGTLTRKLRLAAGTLTLVLGSNGAGKTFFLEKVAGLRDPEGLDIRYQEEPLWIQKRAGRGKRLNPLALLSFGFAGQAPEEGLFQRSLEKELAFSLRPYARQIDIASKKKRIRQALAAVGWNESWLGRDPHLMSGGERRRAALATLFVTPAPWFLLDEPTAGLDREGQKRLAEYLTHLKREGSGILLISHETDWALPLADHVLLFHPDGEVHLCEPVQLIVHPELLAQVGMKVPLWLQVVHALPSRRGDPDIRTHLLQQNRPGEREEAELARRKARRQPPTAHPLTRFDSRSVWLGYIMLSVGIFTLSTWMGLLFGALSVLALIAAGRIPLLRWKGILTGFVIFGAGFAGLNAVRFASPDGGIGIVWDAQAFFQTLFPFARTLTVLLLGLGLPLIWTPLSVRRALEQMAARKGKVPQFWQRNVLIITLTLRFIPVLLKEWERFSRIYLARGKETRKTPAAILRKLRGAFMPLLLALIRLADEAAAALESRGVRQDIQPTISSRLRWKYPDYAIVAGAALLAAFFILIEKNL